MIDRIALVTDFGTSGPYMGQMKLRLSELVPRIPVIDLVADLTAFRPDLAAYLLPALVRDMPERTLYLCVIDPGVGGERAALAVEAERNWYLGPDNGLLAVVAKRAAKTRPLRVDWRPRLLSESFHGRDLFAPVAAMLCAGKVPSCTEIHSSEMVGNDWADELAKVVYADSYGNLITGIRASRMDKNSALRASGQQIHYARTFCEVPPGKAFWHEDSFGLVELSINQGNARLVLGLGPGDRIEH